MEFFQIITLAVVQGLTEFLPVSSSAHLAIVPHLFGWVDQGMFFDIAVHTGTLVAVVIYCRSLIFGMLIGVWKFISGQGVTAAFQQALLLILATIPLVGVGMIGFEMVETYARSLTLIGVTTLLFGLLLGYADWRYSRRPQKLEDEKLNWRGAALIGISQCLAILPGVSRSGITMTSALLVGLNRRQAAEFSFLLSIPTILGAAALATVKYLHGAAETGVLEATPHDFLWGASLSAITAFFAINLMMRLIQKYGFWPFVIYRLGLASVLLALSVAGSL